MGLEEERGEKRKEWKQRQAMRRKEKKKQSACNAMGLRGFVWSVVAASVLGPAAYSQVIGQMEKQGNKQKLSWLNKKERQKYFGEEKLLMSSSLNSPKRANQNLLKLCCGCQTLQSFAFVAKNQSVGFAFDLHFAR